MHPGDRCGAQSSTGTRQIRELGERAQLIVQTVLGDADMWLRLALEHSLPHRVGMALDDPAIALPQDNINHGRIVCSGAPRAAGGSAASCAPNRRAGVGSTVSTCSCFASRSCPSHQGDRSRARPSSRTTCLRYRSRSHPPSTTRYSYMWGEVSTQSRSVASSIVKAGSSSPLS